MQRMILLLSYLAHLKKSSSFSEPSGLWKTKPISVRKAVCRMRERIVTQGSCLPMLRVSNTWYLWSQTIESAHQFQKYKLSNNSKCPAMVELIGGYSASAIPGVFQAFQGRRNLLNDRNLFQRRLSA